MNFEGFTADDFATFSIDGLEQRMEAIRGRIQPKFKIIGDSLSTSLSVLTGNEMYVHIAQHARRTKNPPNDTWLALSHNKRGYKMHPHFQVGLFDDHVFIWLAYIYELPNKKEIAQHFLHSIDEIQALLPEQYVISMDHTKKGAQSIANMSLQQSLERFSNVKKAELLIGKQIFKDDPLLNDGTKFLNTIEDTFSTLLPLYTMSMRINIV
ncbi:DUF1054 domain-containing protein [Longirhabdus pacifica]|uniref:DUF1054 domain-containing protein n=1 Tax=Longirhabdus pacifica TaxID=2305227 RepID=UPI0010087D07|nr:DUF1054 domain-containing protein [Longirhabdus pacifica]